MSGLNRLFVPDLGHQANLMLLYQSEQADVSEQRDSRHRRPRGGEKRMVGRKGRTEGKQE